MPPGDRWELARLDLVVAGLRALLPLCFRQIDLNIPETRAVDSGFKQGMDGLFLSVKEGDVRFGSRRKDTTRACATRKLSSMLPVRQFNP